MISRVEIDETLGLRDYSSIAHLAPLVQQLRSEAELLVPQLNGRCVWMVNSTAHGGGVAEMLPKMVKLLRELGVETQWVVIGSEYPEFFNVTKRIHNMIHGVGNLTLSNEDRELYNKVNQENAAALAPLIKPGDILVIHDPQPLGVGSLLRRSHDIVTIWRCHIGLDERLPVTNHVWRFLEPYLRSYDEAVFSAPEYIPDYLAGRATIIHPAIDPLSHKNRDLYTHKLMGILCNAQLAREHQPVLTPKFEYPAKRLLPSGEWTPASNFEEIGLVYRPVVTQISRWDRLKGFSPLLDAFIKIKTQNMRKDISDRHRRRLELLRLVLAGPDPTGVTDDPEALEVLAELCGIYKQLPADLQKDIVLINLPMQSRKENALIVNALQRCSTVVVQNSIREGFGLTITEAMWKRLPVVSSRACGARQQMVDKLEGRLVNSAEDSVEIARVLDEVLHDQYREILASNAQRRVHGEFLIFTQLQKWLRVLFQVTNR